MEQRTGAVSETEDDIVFVGPQKQRWVPSAGAETQLRAPRRWSTMDSRLGLEVM